MEFSVVLRDISSSHGRDYWVASAHLFEKRFKYIRIRIIFPALDHKYLFKKIDDRDLLSNLFFLFIVFKQQN
jgi:hypothetical protein